MQTSDVSYNILHFVRNQERASAAAAAQQAAALKALREELRRDGKRQEDALERQVPSRAPAPAGWAARSGWAARRHARSRGCGWRGGPRAGAGACRALRLRSVERCCAPPRLAPRASRARGRPSHARPREAPALTRG